MYSFGNKSRAVFATLDPRLQRVCYELLKYVDVSLIYGHRDKATQNRLYAEGKSKLKWPKSKHNRTPSHAVDIQPYPMPEDEKELWAALGLIAGLAIRIADEQGVRIRWGGDWDKDGDVTDNIFDDGFHLELIDD